MHFSTRSRLLAVACGALALLENSAFEAQAGNRAFVQQQNVYPVRKRVPIYRAPTFAFQRRAMPVPHYSVPNMRVIRRYPAARPTPYLTHQIPTRPVISHPSPGLTRYSLPARAKAVPKTAAALAPSLPSHKAPVVIGHFNSLKPSTNRTAPGRLPSPAKPASQSAQVNPNPPSGSTLRQKRSSMARATGPVSTPEPKYTYASPTQPASPPMTFKAPGSWTSIPASGSQTQTSPPNAGPAPGNSTAASSGVPQSNVVISNVTTLTTGPAPGPAASTTNPAVSATSPGYTFNQTPYGTIEVSQNGQRIGTGTAQYAAQYGYNGPGVNQPASSVPIAPAITTGPVTTPSGAVVDAGSGRLISPPPATSTQPVTVTGNGSNGSPCSFTSSGNGWTSTCGNSALAGFGPNSMQAAGIVSTPPQSQISNSWGSTQVSQTVIASPALPTYTKLSPVVSQPTFSYREIPAATTTAQLPAFPSAATANHMALTNAVSTPSTIQNGRPINRLSETLASPAGLNAVSATFEGVERFSDAAGFRIASKTAGVAGIIVDPLAGAASGFASTRGNLPTRITGAATAGIKRIDNAIVGTAGATVGAAEALPYGVASCFAFPPTCEVTLPGAIAIGGIGGAASAEKVWNVSGGDQAWDQAVDGVIRGGSGR